MPIHNASAMTPAMLATHTGVKRSERIAVGR
jgi:hypothetical protein